MSTKNQQTSEPDNDQTTKRGEMTKVRIGIAGKRSKTVKIAKPFDEITYKDIAKHIDPGDRVMGWLEVD